jgi:predicted Zn finger-like uncharacterized protein
MKISCQSCQSKYNVADEKVQGKVVKIRCRKCGATIVVDGNAPAGANGSGAAAAPGPGAAEAGGDGQWHVNVSETDQRSMTLAELVDAYNASIVTQETFIWTDGMDDWRPLGEVVAVVAALHAAASGGQPEQAYGHEAPAEREDAPTQAFSYDQAAAGGYDLPFDGGRAPQVAEAAPVAEPRRAAVVKPRGRDLFGEGGGGAPAGDEVQTSAPSMAQAQSMARAAEHGASSSMGAGSTGERNENSVLFSLAALTKNSGPADVPPPPVGSKDDSGLIDLKALALKTQSSRPVAPKADADLFSAPLGFTPPPLGAPLGALGSTAGGEEAKSKLPLLIGGGIGVLVLMVLSVVVTLKLAGGPAPAPSASASLAPAAPTATATAEPTATATAEASAAASASAAPTAAPKPKAAGGGGGAVVHAGGGAPKPAAAGGGAATPAATAAAPVQTAAPKKASGCEAACAGDLMCLMKCSTH